METEKRLKMLQLFYAGVLADSVRHYSEAGILENVEAKKKTEQKLAAKGQLAQLRINSPREIFQTFSDIFGCITWQVDEKPGKMTATGHSCLLCAIAKKTGLPKPCNIYCINPIQALTAGLEKGSRMNVISTLWDDDKCEFEVLNDE